MTLLSNILCLFFILRVCVTQKNWRTTYLTRWRNVGLCEPSEVVTFLGAPTLYETKEYWNGIMNVSRDFTVEKGLGQLRKCGEGFYPCENFMSMKGDQIVFENIVRTPHQAWSSVVNAFNPKLTSAHFKKGIYTITNATLDIEKAMIVMPEFPDYYWKLVARGWDKNDIPLLCFEAEFHVIKYTPRDKKMRKNG